MDRRRFVGALAASATSAGWPRTASALCRGSGAARGPGGDTGWFARVAPRDGPLVLSARAAAPGTPWSSAYACERQGRTLFNPTLVADTGDRWRIELANDLAQPTIVHWHGLANDTRNDGSPTMLVPAGQRHAYDFIVRERAGLYWYHPHPHGATARQTYEGLFGLVEVSDDDERSLRRALGVVQDETELTLVLQDRRGATYDADDDDRLHGRFGDVPLVNGCVDPVLAVATRRYRLRIVNAANARTFRLGLRDRGGRLHPMTLLGTDGGLLAAPVRVPECFVSPAERVDLLVDFGDAREGERRVLETGAFDAMHSEQRSPGKGTHDAHAAHGAAHEHAHAKRERAPAHASHARQRWPEGARRALVTFDVAKRASHVASLPSRLATIAPIDVARARERSIALGLHDGRWRIDGRVFAMGETPIRVARDSTEVWVLDNELAGMPHAMHLHGFHFQVHSREGSPAQLAALATHPGRRLATDLGWKDTVLVWPGERVRIAIRFALPFPGPQTYFLHCHNLEHEDGGMMVGVSVG